MFKGLVGADGNFALGAVVSRALGRSGEGLVAHLHGKWYSQALKGSVFIGSTAIGGTIIPANANNLVSTFTLWNPAGSGRNLELIKYLLGLAGATTAVIGHIGLAYQAQIGSNIAVPSSQTALTPTNGLIGAGQASVAKLLSAGTLTGTPTFLQTMGLNFGTTGASPGPTKAEYEFDGSVIVPPGALVTVVGEVAQTEAMAQAFVWAETPLAA